MTVQPRSLLCAAICAATITSVAYTRDLQLGAPLQLPESATTRDHEAPSDADALPQSETEHRGLGQPRGFLKSSKDEAAAPSETVELAENQGRLGSIGGDAWQVLSAMAVVVALLFMLRTVIVRCIPGLRGGGRPSGVLEVLARYPIARGQHLLLIKLVRRVILVHQSGSTMTTLTEVSDPAEVASLLGRVEAGTSSPREAAKFRTLLRQFSKEHDTAIQVESASGVRDAWESGEVVDLTRQRGGLKSLIARSGTRGAR